jgi:hypothetical protein
MERPSQKEPSMRRQGLKQGLKQRGEFPRKTRLTCGDTVPQADP